MRRTTRLLAAALVALIAATVGVGPVLSQAGPTVGTEVPVVDDTGITHGTIQVKELDDPFTAFDPSRPAAPGSRYVGLTVVFTAADDQQLDANQYSVVIRDTDGYLYVPQFVPRPADDPIPDLQSQTLAPGNRISGFVGYILPEGAAIDEVVYTTSTYVALQLVDVDTTPAPAIGQPIDLTAKDGSQGRFTLTITDPFTSTTSTPAEGMRFLGLGTVIENIGASVFEADPTDLYLRSATGALYYPVGFALETTSTLPYLQAQSLAPGDRISGLVGYAIPVGETIVAVDLWPDSARRVTLAAVSGGGPAPTAGPVVTAAPAASVTPPPPSTPEPPVASPTPGQSAGVSQ